jgi:hypothetical protein
MTDLELAKAFFDRLKSKGVGINYNCSAYGECEGEEPRHIVVEIASMNHKDCWQFDFYGDGSFYRMSGFCDSYWQDEIDGKKY